MSRGSRKSKRSPKRPSKIAVVDLETIYGNAPDIIPYGIPLLRGHPVTAILIDDAMDFEREILQETLRESSIVLEAFSDITSRERARRMISPEAIPFLTLDSFTRDYVKDMKDFQIPFFPSVERPILPAELRYKKILALVAVTKMKVRV